MADLLVGADIGTSACKATLLRADDGVVLGAVTERYEPTSPRPGWSEQDPDAWYRAVVHAIARLLTERPGSATDVRGIGIAGQMRGLVLVDATGTPVRPAILWNDNRCHEEVAGIVGAELERLGAITHNVLNTMCTLPKLLWLRRHEPASLAMAATMLYPKDYVRMRFTGERATDLSDASGSSLYDVEAQDWSTELLQRYGIPPRLLPPVLRATDIAGTLTARAAAEMRPAPGRAGHRRRQRQHRRVVLHRPDRPAQLQGASGHLWRRLDRGRRHLRALAAPTSGRSCAMIAGCSTPTRAPVAQAVRWLRETAYSEIESDEDAFAAIDREAADRARRRRGSALPSLPARRGRALLGSDAARVVQRPRRQHIGVPHLARAVLEGTAFALRDAMTTLGDWVPGFERSIFVGGGTLSPTWLAIVGDVLAMDGEVPEAADASLGAAMLAGVGVGLFESLEASVERCYRVRERIDHDPGERRGLRRYLRALPRTRPGGGARMIRVVGANPAMDRVSTWPSHARGRGQPRQ